MQRRNESHAVRRQGVVEVRAYETADVAAMAEVWNEVVRDGVAFPQEDELDATGAAEFFGSGVKGTGHLTHRNESNDLSP